MKRRLKQVFAIVLAIATSVSVMPDMGMGMLAQAAQSEAVNDLQTAGGTTEEEISSKTYEELGMGIDEKQYSEELGDKPLAEGTAMNVQNELYTTARGTQGYSYQVRDISKLNAMVSNLTDGLMYGAFPYYGVNSQDSDSMDGMIGNQGTLYNGKEYDRNYKTYAMDTAFNAGEGKDNYIAEVTVNDLVGDNAKTWLDIYKIGDDGKRVWKAAKQLGSLPKKFMETYRSLQEFDAVIEVAAGDFGNVGYDDIVTYCGDSIMVFDFSKESNTLTQKATMEVAKPSPLGAGTTTDYRSMSVVTFSAGDLKRDNTEELVVNVSMPYGSDNYATQAKTYLWDYKDGKFVQDEVIALVGEDDATHAMMGANSAIGTIGGEPVLFIGGYSAWNKESWSFGEVMYKTATWDKDGGKDGVGMFNVADTIEMENTNKELCDSLKTDNALMLDSNYDIHWICQAPISMATAKTKGRAYDSQLFFNGILWNYDAAENSISQIQKIAQNKTTMGIGIRNNNHYWIGNVTAGNFTSDADGKEQIMAVVGKGDNKQKDFELDIASIWKSTGGSNDGYFTAQEGAVYNAPKSNSGNPILTLAAADVDSDSTMVRFNNQKIVYSDPVVYTVLQASPYFSDLAELFPDSYPTNAVTSYETYKSSSTEVKFGVTASMGVYTSAEVQLGGGLEVEQEVTTSLSADVAMSTTKTTTMSYEVNSSTQDNKVVAYMQPYVVYEYDIYDTATKTWIDRGMVVQVPLKASNTFLDVSKYNEIASRTKGLEPITALTNTIGDPTTYKNVPSGFKCCSSI